MAGFEQIVGHRQIIEHLKNAIVLDKVSHAYLLNGPDKSGKMMLAEAFAQTLQCEEVQDYREQVDPEDMMDPARRTNILFRAEPCGKCHSCKQAVGKNQPDIVYVTHEKPNTISVNDVREQINNDIEVRPYSSKYKIYIVDEAEKMNAAAQNALLKTLEEPPAYGVILLLTTNADALLQTIRSRCVRLDLKAVEDGKIREHLMKNCGIPDYQADLCVAFAQGNVGKAIMLAGSEQFREMKDFTLQLLRKLENMPGYEVNQAIKPLEDYKDNIRDFFDLMTMWYRDVLLYKSGGSEENLIFRDAVYEISQQAKRSTFHGLNLILQAVDRAANRIQFNVNFELTMEVLMMEIKENIL